jgi:hypothetical protein
VAGSSSDWVTLIEAAGRLSARFGLDSFEMIERVVRSAEVPVRALRSHTHSIPIRIEKEINSDMSVDIFGLSYCIRDQFRTTLWWDVEISWPKCLAYCKANLLSPSSPGQEQRQRRGRRNKIEGVKEAMKLALQQNEILLEKLKAMTGKELAHRFKVSRTTATAARIEVLKGY